MRCYMQLAYLFHLYAKSLLSTDGRIADCTVRHPGVERPFSSCIKISTSFDLSNYLMTPVIYGVVFAYVYQCRVFSD